VDDLRTAHVTSGPLRYRDTGSGPALVFVHGIFVNGLVWQKVVPELASRFRCIVPDLPLGAHAVPMRAEADQSPPGIAALIVELIRALDLHDVTLIGNDTGGALCQLAIASDPDCAARLVLIDCDSYEKFFPLVLAPFQILPRIPGFLWLFTKVMQPYVLRVAFAALVARNIPDRNRLNSFFTPSLESDGVRRDVKRFLTSISNRQTIAAAETFAAFEAPVLIAWGEDDLFFPMRDAERLAAAFPNARLERIAGSRTLVQEDQPERLVELISAFAGASAAAVTKA
jgi:pimeloyl-ACP methyl ester carboxylesterase